MRESAMRESSGEFSRWGGVCCTGPLVRWLWGELSASTSVVALKYHFGVAIGAFEL